MNEFQQIVDGGVGAMVFYLLYVTVNIIRDAISGKSKLGKNICMEHGAMCAHLEVIKEDVAEIKKNLLQIVSTISRLQGRIEE